MTADTTPTTPEAQPRVTAPAATPAEPTNGNGATAAAEKEKKPARDLVGEFKQLAGAEKLAAIAAAAVLLGFVVANLWVQAFGNWFYACALLGSLGVLLLTAAQLFEVRFLEARTRGVLLLTFAFLPALGFVIETLYDTWVALMLAGAGAMAWAAIRILLGEDDT